MLSSRPAPAGTPPLGASPSHPPPRTAPYEVEPGYCAQLKLWLYGNTRTLHGRLAMIPVCVEPDPQSLEEAERRAEELVLSGHTLVCGVHNLLHQRVAIVPLRWGAPRILVFAGGFKHHLGSELNQEPFRAARLWRYAWDPKTDLAISRRAPDKLPTYATNNPTVDRLIRGIAEGTWPGLRDPVDMLQREQGCS